MKYISRRKRKKKTKYRSKIYRKTDNQTFTNKRIIEKQEIANEIEGRKNNDRLRKYGTGYKINQDNNNLTYVNEVMNRRGRDRDEEKIKGQ